MKVKIRRSCNDDLEDVYNLHARCFSQTDLWYRNAIANYLERGVVIEDKINNTLIGVMLQGIITPCNRSFELEESSSKFTDVFEPVHTIGELFVKNDAQYKDIYGIVMICVDPNFRGKGLAKKLIEKHFQDNPSRVLCLNTRRSNIGAYSLYKKMGYTHIAFIKNKYFQPNEDSIFMIKDLSE